MLKILYLLFFIFLNFQDVFCQDHKYLPKCNNPIYQKEHYWLAYDNNHKQASWTCYELILEELLFNNIERTNDFKIDIEICGNSASLIDYRKSGFDRGHLVPAGDMKFSKKAMSESFLLSNISPKYPYFNRVIWKNLEENVRKFVIKNGKAYVITGPILNDVLGKIGENQISIPNSFFKIIFNESDQKIFCFLIPNFQTLNYNVDIMNFLITVDELENLTNIDFFHQLRDDIEDEIESKIFKFEN